MKQKRKSNILTIVKKELRRFFGDKRMVMTILLPGLLIYAIYSLNPIKIMPIMLVVVVILSTILVFLVSKIPHMKKWTGMG